MFRGVFMFEAVSFNAFFTTTIKNIGILKMYITKNPNATDVVCSISFLSSIFHSNGDVCIFTTKFKWLTLSPKSGMTFQITYFIIQRLLLSLLVFVWMPSLQ